MNFIYLFDPLCGWCYASSRGIGKLARSENVQVFATGLFASTGKVIDAHFANHAWMNDTRISQLTGLPFSENYRQLLLKSGAFDSFALTQACFLLNQESPHELLPTFAQLQKLRYVEGLDTSDIDIVKQGLIALGKADIAERLGDDEVISGANAWMRQGQVLAHKFQINGVPSLIADIDGKFVNVPSQFLYQDSENVARNIKQFLA